MPLDLLRRLRLFPAARFADCFKGCDNNLDKWNHALRLLAALGFLAKGVIYQDEGGHGFDHGHGAR
jgi:hypothetical protein